MRKAGMSINEVKEKILSLKGREVEMNINRGRKKFESLSGIIKDVYPSVFTVETGESKSSVQTFS